MISWDLPPFVDEALFQLFDQYSLLSFS